MFIPGVSGTWMRLSLAQSTTGGPAMYILKIFKNYMNLYERVKRNIIKKNPVHSAYRSALIVKTFKKLGGHYVGPKPKTTGLARWFKEKWQSDRGLNHYTSRSSVFRPTVRVTRKTPKTFSELSKARVARAKRQKFLKGRVLKF